MGTAHADAKVLSAENSHCQRYAVLEIPAVGQIIAVYASPRALSPACLISAFSVRSTSFIFNPLLSNVRRSSESKFTC